ncbi:MAG TPA: Asp-tRNA(Asn)/Glu-tRNA(Gln) amidotransferase subunit GatB [Bacteroidia bacterium]|jgi:aspartyl-tRNA(Asn)/glutamyl-tRNA(Gln) amidotransferase subunit B|nr:Asp-tRNA(Asn)/Glu-tRNA(Gln) amidotransferase subunit GatB [Bacteroidia bacterium]
MSESVYDKYQPVIGLEVHAQLLTKSKAYAGEAAEYGAMPNTLVGPVSLGLPGTLPKANRSVIEFAIRLGLATKCTIRERNEYARKNYFYADLPKGYQVTQDKTPICMNGVIKFKNLDGTEKIVRIQRIHMEEDAGKSMHDVDPDNTLIDLNRAGVPLVEIVSEPDIRNAEEAYRYLTEVRRLVRYLDICDGNMEEGSLRCDANVSVMLKGAKEFGRRVEVKNMNSISNVKRAIEHEIKRQIDIIEAGGIVDQDTRSFEALTGTTFSLRSKEQANDYRYFPEPDLQPVIVTEKEIARVKSTLPPLPAELFERYTKELSLSEYDAHVITDSKEIALYYEEMLLHTKNAKAAANWLMGPIKSYLNENAVHISAFPLKPAKIAELISIIDSGKVSFTSASQKLFPEMIADPSADAMNVAEKLNLVQQSDSGALLEFVKQAVAKYPAKVTEYKNGKVGLLGMFMGEVMKLSGGKADPKVTTELLKKELEQA